MSDSPVNVMRVDVIGAVTELCSTRVMGIAQVGSAISNLDQMTQQNAALVEESAAAASGLQDQAERLARTVGQFRIG